MSIGRRQFVKLGTLGLGSAVLISSIQPLFANDSKSNERLRSIWATVSSLDMTNKLDEIMVEPNGGKYPPVTVESPTKGKLIVRFADKEGDKIEVAILRPDKDGRYELCHISVAGGPVTTLHIPKAGIALTVGYLTI